jgi:hypothetical protein
MRPRPHFGDLVFGLVDLLPPKKTSGEGVGASPDTICTQIYRVMRIQQQRKTILLRVTNGI